MIDTASSPRSVQIIDGVAFEIAAHPARQDGREVLALRVRLTAVDGGCHGVVKEPLRTRARYATGTGGMVTRPSRSGDIYPVVWLAGATATVFEASIPIAETNMKLAEVTIGFYEVESSRAGWSMSPEVARITVRDPDSRIEILRVLEPQAPPHRGAYLSHMGRQCPNR